MDNLRLGLANVVRQYAPKLIGIATTCLAETIGDDVAGYLRQIRAEAGGSLPELVHASTPSYAGTHAEGFQAAVRALVDALAQDRPKHEAVNLLPGPVSPADLRYLQVVFRDFGLEPIVLPDYSDTLDAPVWKEYQRIPQGGTAVESICRMGGAKATVEFACTGDMSRSAGAVLDERFGVPRHEFPLPVGVSQTDSLFAVLRQISGRPIPPVHEAERGRLIDSYIDAHKYVFGRRAIVYGEQDLIVGLASLLAEIGMVPALCASGARTGRLEQQVRAVAPDIGGQVTVLEGVDFAEIEERAVHERADLVIGNSKGYGLARRLRVPLVRVGFPVHDRIDGPRLLHVGYRGAQQLFDRIANALIETAQDTSEVGYSYM
jgi:nitrogenase molybdenum-iron protein NifN